MCMSDHDGFEHVFRAGAVDAVANVLVWNDRLSGRNPFSEGNPEGKETGSVHIRIFECISDFRRNHESCVDSDGIRKNYKEKSDRILYFRCTCGSGTGYFYRDFSVDLKQTSAGKTGKSKEKIRAFKETGEKGGK